MDQQKYLNFSIEMSERQIYVREFFGVTLLESIRRNFGLDNVLILCFDAENQFLSWTDRSGVYAAAANHPYLKFAQNDVIGQHIYREAIGDKLSYFDTTPRVYRGTDIVGLNGYDHSATARFLESSFGAHYCAVMAMGIHAYIRIVVWKTLEEGDFTDEEIRYLENIYAQIAHAYRNFKKYEQSKIISAIQDRMIETGEAGAYLVADQFQHVLSCSQTALDCLTDMFGSSVAGQIRRDQPCPWLRTLTGEDAGAAPDAVRLAEIRGYRCKCHVHDQRYSHGIVDRYYWIVISRGEEPPSGQQAQTDDPVRKLLTPTEQKVASLLCRGLTYQEIADRLIVSYHTVKTHVQNIFAKCGVRNRHQLYQIWRD